MRNRINKYWVPDGGQISMEGRTWRERRHGLETQRWCRPRLWPYSASQSSGIDEDPRSGRLLMLRSRMLLVPTVPDFRCSPTCEVEKRCKQRRKQRFVTLRSGMSRSRGDPASPNPSSARPTPAPEFPGDPRRLGLCLSVPAHLVDSMRILSRAGPQQAHRAS